MEVLVTAPLTPDKPPWKGCAYILSDPLASPVPGLVLFAEAAAAPQQEHPTPQRRDVSLKHCLVLQPGLFGAAKWGHTLL